MSAVLNNIEKIALNVAPYSGGTFDPNDSSFVNKILFIRESGVTESSTGSPTGYIYLNGVKYADGLDTYINSVTYLNGYDEGHPYSLEFQYTDKTKDVFYVNIGDIKTLYDTIDSLSATVDQQFEAIPEIVEKSVSGIIISAFSGVYEDIDSISGIVDSRIEELSGAMSACCQYHSDIEADIYDKLDKCVVSAQYKPYDKEDGAVLELHLLNNDVKSIRISDIDYIIEHYQPAVDNGLKTNDKTISGAINEVYDSVSVVPSISASVEELNKVNKLLEERISILEDCMENAYVDADFFPDVNTLRLQRFNGEVTDLLINPSSGRSSCCCPIAEILQDGDSWIQKLGRRVTNLENVVYNQSGNIENISVCVDDLEKRVRTLENEVSLDDDIIADYTTVPVSAWSMSELSIPVIVSKYDSGYTNVSVTKEGSTTNPYPYVSLNFEYNGKSVDLDLMYDNDGDVTLEDVGITSGNFVYSTLKRSKGKSVTVKDFTTMQSYVEDFDSQFVSASTMITDGIVKIQDITALFNRTEYIESKLNTIGFTRDVFDRMEVLEGATRTSITDFDEAMYFILGNIDKLKNNKVTVIFVSKVHNVEVTE